MGENVGFAQVKSEMQWKICTSEQIEMSIQSVGGEGGGRVTIRDL
jgi:hypothetical protein